MHYRRDRLYGNPNTIKNVGRKIDKGGYVQVRTEIGNGSKGKYTYEHRLVMQEMIGRTLVKGETVHHKNGDKHDNRLKNLELISRSNHGSMHGKQALLSPKHPNNKLKKQP